MNVYFQKCRNDTKINKTDCYPEEVIMKRLDNILVTTIMLDNDIKLNNVNEPFQPFLRSTLSPLSTSVYKNEIREITEIRINSNKNLIFGSYEEEKNHRMRLKREEIDLRTDHALFPGTFNQMTFITSGDTQIYYRDYRKLFDVITQLGGFFNGIIYVATLLLYVYSSNMILWECIYNNVSSKELEKGISGTIKNAIKSDVINVNKPPEEERKENSNENNNERNNNSVEQLRIMRNDEVNQAHR